MSNYDTGGKTMPWRKGSLFNKPYCENWATMYRRVKLEHSLTPYTKINSIGKWLKVLNVRSDTIKLEENIHHSNTFLDPPPKAKEIKAKINKCT